MAWQLSEQKAYQWFKSNIDSNAEYLGGEDSTKADIYSPLYNGYIEVKDITTGARSGQFTESVIKNNPFSQNIYDGDCSPLICSNFVQYHYNKKNVTHFIIIDNNEIYFYNFDDFFANYTFKVQNPYEKRSGTNHAPKKDIPILLNMDKDFSLGNDGYVYCINPAKWGKYISAHEAFDYFISKTNKGELRKRSTTKNMTWHLLIEKI